jgi:phage terminase small subunit
MNPRHRLFADYYIETGIASEAYRKAGYKGKGNTAEAAAARLLSNVKVKALINARIAEKDSQRVAKQDEVLEFLTKVMRGEMTEEIALGQGRGLFSFADKDLYVRDRVRAAELLGRRYSMWTERQFFQDLTGVQIIDDVGVDLLGGTRVSGEIPLH